MAKKDEEEDPTPYAEPAEETEERLAAAERSVDEWFEGLVKRAEKLTARLETKRKQMKRKGGGYAPLRLVVRRKGYSIEIRWQQEHTTGPLGQKPKGRFWMTAVRRDGQRKGGGFNLAELDRLALEPEKALVRELELEARLVRRDHSDMIVMRDLTARLRRRLDGRAVVREAAVPAIKKRNGLSFSDPELDDIL